MYSRNQKYQDCRMMLSPSDVQWCRQHKVSFGNSTSAGAYSYRISATDLQTCRLKGKNQSDFIHSIWIAARSFSPIIVDVAILHCEGLVATIFQILPTTHCPGHQSTFPLQQ
jgi:hypothetical protein